mmetsp:Transcript_53307/g.147647  ORF Transcript_53307/g.147647 Transcript_53307/m.147647 type:complete len:247 (-) Transcript_53307:271-1011(-)
MVGLQSIVHLTFVAVAASQAGSGVSESCPEPVKSSLRNRSLWELEVHNDCEHGMAQWHGVTETFQYYGEWPSLCLDPNNASMLIRSMPHGLYDDCQMDADCWTIPCGTKCMENRCVPMEPSCMNTTTTFMAPANFEEACPADPRDMTCMEMKDSWDEAGCHIFDEMPEDAPPPNAEFASQCLPYLTQYEACVEELFEGSYREHRLSPVHEIYEFLASFMAGGGGPRCVKVDPASAKALNAIPCTQP